MLLLRRFGIGMEFFVENAVTTLYWKRQLTSIILMTSFSCAALGGDSPSASGAVLHSSGKVQVNGASSPEIIALFPGDSIQTTKDSVANITAVGSSVLVVSNSLITFIGPGVELIQGGVSVTTSEEITISSYGLTFTPAGPGQSKFEVVAYEDSVIIAARQGNVIVADGRQTSTVPEGQESTHRKKKGAATLASESSRSISGKTLAIVGGASGATVAGILIAQSNKKKKCVSASNNKKCKCKKDQHGNEDCEEDD
jgi:hypothetical protein